MTNKEHVLDGSQDSLTAVDYINQQEQLEREARTLMPFDPNECTYELGELRQQVYACLTCSKMNDNQPIGVCYSCSIQCHSKHELVELFTKRSFLCDCGTTRMAKTPNGACNLRRAGLTNPSLSSGPSSRQHSHVDLPAEDIPGSSNVYNQNFHGTFCDCKQPYDPLEETGNMLQCYFGFECGEDWFHDRCIMGLSSKMIEKGSKVESSRGGKDGHTTTQEQNDTKNTGPLNNAQKKHTEHDAKNEADEVTEISSGDDDSDEEEDADDMIKRLQYFPRLNSFEEYICWRCVAKFRDIFMQLDQKFPGVIVEKLPRFKDIENVTEWNTLKREEISQDKKRVKKESDTKHLEDPHYSVFLGKHFKKKLTENISKLDHESSLYQFLQNNPYLYDNDPVYKPPEDASEDAWSTAGSNADSSAVDAIHSLPRDQAIEGIQAYNAIKSKLRDFFKPFAEQGRVVTEDEVKNFFEDMAANDRSLG
ncbi:hypothetical protein CANMA_003034 [Candida margitis]|uniref:uncharacterized protein n=1 Tax=Candida margitis TaxID=1775924 RepID=UPI002227CA0C|nr:uncharacterized protein CANMA_003034 [Candida margitis]KAI5967488.1 hypothetical protein CANMA_003034 [Candida margitis]